MKKSPRQKGDNQDEVPNFIAKPHLSPKAQEEFHQQHKHCSTHCIIVSNDWGNVKCLQSYLPPLHDLPTNWLDVLPKLKKTRGDAYQ